MRKKLINLIANILITTLVVTLAYKCGGDKLIQLGFGTFTYLVLQIIDAIIGM